MFAPQRAHRLTASSSYAEDEARREWRSAPSRRVRVHLQELLDRFVETRPDLAVLDAGCGSSPALALPPNARRTGLDVSARQLERNVELDEKILGDLQETRFPADRFDVILCWTVLEHLHDPRRALDNLVHALAPGGLLILGVPNVLSVKGLLTKLTPLQFHVWCYWAIHGSTVAGHDDVGPFPTFLRMAISPRSLRRYGARNNLTLLHIGTYEGGMQRRARARFGLTGTRWRVIRMGTLAATLGVIDPAATEVAAVMQKNAGAPRHG